MNWRVISMGDGPGRGDGLDDLETGVATRTRAKTKKPSNYKVLMLNDDYTPMEFVVLVLQRFFSMSIEDATRVMLQVHQRASPCAASSPTKSPRPRSARSSTSPARTSTRCSARWRKPDLSRCCAPWVR
jgi:hypothetical protein